MLAKHEVRPPALTLPNAAKPLISDDRSCESYATPIAAFVYPNRPCVESLAS
jgi:hypothetical protein